MAGAFVVDMGAQYFHPAPYPTYTALLDHLGLRDPGLEWRPAQPVRFLLRSR